MDIPTQIRTFYLTVHHSEYRILRQHLIVMMGVALLPLFSIVGYTLALQIKKENAIEVLEEADLSVRVRKGGGLCAGDRIVPQFYLMGAQKAATTTISDAFQSAGGLLAREPQCMQCMVRANLLSKGVSSTEEESTLSDTDDALDNSGMHEMTLPSTHHRCENEPVEINGATWGNLGRGIDEDTCKKACLAEQKCNFAVMNLQGSCSAYLQCRKFSGTPYTWNVYAKQHQSLVPMENVEDYDKRYGVTIEKLETPSPHHRCDDRPANINGDEWNNLATGDAEHCQQACLAEARCNFAVMNGEGHCSAFESCDSFVENPGVWQVFVKKHDSVDGVCRWFCDKKTSQYPWEQICNWEKCNQCDPCQEAMSSYGGKSVVEMIEVTMRIVQNTIDAWGAKPEDTTELAEDLVPVCITSPLVSNALQSYGWDGSNFNGTPDLQSLLNNLGSLRVNRIENDCQAAGGLWHPTNVSSAHACSDADGFWMEDHFQKERRLFSANRPEEDFAQPAFLEELAHGYPACPQEGTPPVLAADFSTYFSSPVTAGRIALAYGDAAPQVTFALSLRDPMLRLQSVFEHLKQEPWATEWTRHQFAKNEVWASFNSFVRNLMLATRRTNECNKGPIGDQCEEAESLRPGYEYRYGEMEMDFLLLSLLRGSLYGSALDLLLKSVLPEQVILAPMNDIVGGGSQAEQFMHQVQTMTQVNVEEKKSMPSIFAEAVSNHTASNSHANSGNAITDVKDDEDMKNLRKIMDQDMEVLVKVLVDKSQISLPTYKGAREYESIRAWLVANW